MNKFIEIHEKAVRSTMAKHNTKAPYKDITLNLNHPNKVSFVSNTSTSQNTKGLYTPNIDISSGGEIESNTTSHIDNTLKPAGIDQYPKGGGIKESASPLTPLEETPLMNTPVANTTGSILGNTPGKSILGKNTQVGNIPERNTPEINTPDINTPGRNIPERNIQGESVPSRKEFGVYNQVELAMVNKAKQEGRKIIDVATLTGKGVYPFWNRKGRYTAWKGSRASKKSKTVALFIIYYLMRHPLAHALCIRRWMVTHRDSTYADLKWATRRLGVSDLWSFPKGEVKATYKPTGQQILFRGADNPESITSISVPFGGICIARFEEAYQIEDEATFDMIDESLRGGFIDTQGNEIGMPDGYVRRIILTFNPWSEHTWIKKRFFDTPDPSVLAFTTTYKINEWLTDADRQRMEDMRLHNPKRYAIAGLGEWGIETDVTYTEFNENSIKPSSELMRYEYVDYAIGIDTGYSNGQGKLNRTPPDSKKSATNRIKSATTMILVGLKNDYKTLCVLEEYFWTNQGKDTPKSAPEIQEDLINTIINWTGKYRAKNVILKGRPLICVDSADVGTRQNLERLAQYKYGLYHYKFVGSTKRPISTRVNYTNQLLAWGEFIVSSVCPNLIREMNNSHIAPENGAREDIDDHTINACEYAWAPLTNKMQRWKDFKDANKDAR